MEEGGRPDYDLFTSLRYDSKLLTADFNNDVNATPLPYLLFPYHLQRLVDSSRKFAWPEAIKTITAPSAADDLRKKCDQAIAECILPEKEKGVGVRIQHTIFDFIFAYLVRMLRNLKKFNSVHYSLGAWNVDEEHMPFILIHPRPALNDISAGDTEMCSLMIIFL